ncbi:MAG: kinase/pyrophosphorylase [Caldilineaceae bacterium]|nr:kinase/pyrophosphorylase [Caldilineaceae bacterium]
MPTTKSRAPSQAALKILIVSGGSGASGEQVVHSLLAQFPLAQVSVEVLAHVRSQPQIVDAVAHAAACNAVLVHTLVDGALRQLLLEAAVAQRVVIFDLFGPLLEHLAGCLGQAPLGKPGLYQQLHAAYFKRVEAIEYAVAHDDGKRIEELSLAEVVLTGVSRVGKTPLSMYLSVLGWKVANVPLILQIAPPPELLAVDPLRVVGLTIAPVQLLAHRRWRTKSIGLEQGGYVDRQAVQEELRAANHFFATHGFVIVDTTDKPVETSGEEVIAAVSRAVAGVG